MRRIFDLPIWTMLLSILVQPAHLLCAQGATVSSPVELAHLADQLRPGQWVLAPSVAPEGPILIYVDLSRQRATVYRNGVRIGVTTISSGRPHYDTPIGVFTILQKDAKHRSKKYDNAPMPYSERLTWDGVALHAGGVPGYPESHGCVHLPYEFARELFGMTDLGVTVIVAGNAASHVTTLEDGVLAPFDAEGEALPYPPLDSADFRWTPEKSPTGPLTIIVSKHDQTIVVLRNGIEIGRSRSQINDDDPGSHVITLTSGPDGKPLWTYVGLPGHPEDQSKVLDDATINRVKMPPPFYDALKAELRPGTTILVTQSSVGAQAAGPRGTILDGVKPVL